MARIRTIKPEFPQSESMGRVSRDARLLFIMLWTICDDSGRARANSRMLASLLFPYDEDAGSLMEGWLSELEREKCIVRYESGSDKYIAITKWADHQKIDKPSKSRFPEPPDFARKSRKPAKPREPSALDQGPKEGTKDQGPGFDEFWLACPKKVAKPETMKAFVLATKSAPAPVLIEKMREYAAERQGKDPQYTLHPSNWLDQGRWLDELAAAPAALSADEAAAAMDKADRLLRRGKYAPEAA